MALRKTVVVLFCCVLSDAYVAAQSRGVQAIRGEDMQTHLEFLSAREFDGRSAPSTALNIASRYLALQDWFFCGTTSDYHQETDSPDKADLAKAEKVAKLTYPVCLDIGNKPALLKLDINPEITSRGAQNMKINWLRPAHPEEKK